MGHLFIVVLPFLLLAGFGYDCAIRGELNLDSSSSKEDSAPDSNTTDANSTDTWNSTEIFATTEEPSNSNVDERNIRSVVDMTWWDSQIDGAVRDLIENPRDNEEDARILLRRFKRRGGRARVRGGSRTRTRTGTRGGGSSSVEIEPCEANYVMLIAIGIAIMLVYIAEGLFIFMTFEDYRRYVLIAIGVFECIVYFIYLGVAFHASTLDTKEDRKPPALIVLILCSILYSLRAIVLMIVCGVIMLKDWRSEDDDGNDEPAWLSRAKRDERSRGGSKLHSMTYPKMF